MIKTYKTLAPGTRHQAPANTNKYMNTKISTPPPPEKKCNKGIRKKFNPMRKKFKYPLGKKMLNKLNE